MSIPLSSLRAKNVGQHPVVFLLVIAVDVFDHSAGQKIQLDYLPDRPYPSAYNRIHNNVCMARLTVPRNLCPFLFHGGLAKKQEVINAFFHTEMFQFFQYRLQYDTHSANSLTNYEV